MDKITEDIIWNKLKEHGKKSKILNTPCCNLEILKEVNESSFLKKEQKEKLSWYTQKFKDEPENISVDIIVLNSKEKTLCYIIPITEKEYFFGLKIDFENEPVLIHLNKEFYEKEESKIGYTIFFIYKNLNGKYKDLFSNVTIIFTDMIEVNEKLKEFEKETGKEFKRKNKITEYYTTFSEFIFKENNEEEMYYVNEIINEEIKVDISFNKILAETFKDDKDLFEFITKKIIEENEGADEEEISSAIELITKFNKDENLEEKKENIIKN